MTLGSTYFARLGVAFLVELAVLFLSWLCKLRVAHPGEARDRIQRTMHAPVAGSQLQATPLSRGAAVSIPSELPQPTPGEWTLAGRGFLKPLTATGTSAERLPSAGGGQGHQRPVTVGAPDPAVTGLQARAAAYLRSSSLRRGGSARNRHTSPAR